MRYSASLNPVPDTATRMSVPASVKVTAKGSPGFTSLLLMNSLSAWQEASVHGQAMTSTDGTVALRVYEMNSREKGGSRLMRVFLPASRTSSFDR